MEKARKTKAKFLAAVLTVALMFGIMPQGIMSVLAAQATQPITVIVNGDILNFDMPPQIVNDRIVVQIRAIAEKLGCSVFWDDATQTSYINQPGVPLQQNAVKGNGINVYVNNEPVVFPDQKPLMMNDYVMIPSRPVVEKLGCTIDWNDQTQTQTISSGNGQSNPTSTVSPSTPTTPPVTPATTVTPTPAVTSVPASSGELSLLSITSPVSHNETATVKVQGKPNTPYTIDVHYPSGISSAEGVSGSDKTKTSDSNGVVSWSWTIGSQTSKQTHYLIVSGAGQSLRVEFEVQ